MEPDIFSELPVSHALHKVGRRTQMCNARVALITALPYIHTFYTYILYIPRINIYCVTVYVVYSARADGISDFFCSNSLRSLVFLLLFYSSDSVGLVRYVRPFCKSVLQRRQETEKKRGEKICTPLSIAVRRQASARTFFLCHGKEIRVAAG